MSFRLEAAGAVTAVGRNLTLTMASVYTKTQRYDDLGLCDERGEPLSGARTPLEVDAFVPRLAHLVSLALVDVGARLPPSPARPLVIHGPEELEDAAARNDLLGALFADLSSATRELIRQDRLAFLGRPGAGFEAALGEAMQLASAGARSGHGACLLVSVDCLTAPHRVRRLLREDKILSPGKVRGLLPGEGAVALSVALPEGSREGPMVDAAFEKETARPSTGKALTRAVARAFGLARDAGNPGRELGLVHDTAFDGARAEELVYARARAPLAACEALETFSPLMSTGDLGVANPALGLATAAFLLEKGVVGSSALATVGDDLGNRGAMLVRHRRPSTGDL